MQTMTFLATLDSDVVISETSATAGVHKSLDYLPGACLLGACAARLYDELKPEESYLIFHSGKVQFGNAYPLAESGVPAIPVPVAWHCFKGESPVKDGRLAPGIINCIHYAMTKEDEEQQPKQMRAGYFTLCGLAPRIETNYRLKTAIDRKSKQASESQLFGYEHLTTGSRWWFELNYDDDVNQELIQKIRTALLGAIRLGRSRTAEFGRATIASVDERFKAGSESDNLDFLTLYCFSDLALRDENSGAPTLIPAGCNFGLADVVLDKEKSFIRTRCYAPFNGTRRANDLERQVITKGSVITFRKENKDSFDKTELSNLQTRLVSGTGMYRQDGLGRVLLNPLFLNSGKFVTCDTVPLSSPVAKSQGASYTSELTEWLEDKSATISGDKDIMAQIEEWAATLKVAFQVFDQEKRYYPGNSQWSAIRAVSGTKAEIAKSLFCDAKGEEGFCLHGVSEEQWKAEFRYGDSWISFANFLKDIVLPHYTDDASTIKALQLMGNRMPHIINQMKGDK